MRGFATSSNPYVTGKRPKRFFSARYEMLKKEIMLGKTTKKETATVITLKTNYDNQAA